MTTENLIHLLKVMLVDNDEVKQLDIAKAINVSPSAISKFKRNKLILSEEKQRELFEYLLRL